MQGKIEMKTIKLEFEKSKCTVILKVKKSAWRINWLRPYYTKEMRKDKVNKNCKG